MDEEEGQFVRDRGDGVVVEADGVGGSAACWSRRGGGSEAVMEHAVASVVED